MEENNNRYHVPNLDRALSILELLVEHADGLTNTEITKALDYSANSVYRITATLLNRHYLLRDEDTKRFRLDRKLLALGYAAVSEHNIVEQSMAVMRGLRDATSESVLLSTVIEHEGIVLAQVPSLHPIRVQVDPGTRFELHAAAGGKAMLAFLAETERKRILDQMPFTAYNANTITDKAAFLDVLHEIRQQGYALDRSEALSGLHCAGAPIFDHHHAPVASLYVSAPADRMPEEALDALGERVREAANAISRQLGCQLATCQEQTKASA